MWKMSTKCRTISVDLISLIEFLVLFILLISALIQVNLPQEKKTSLERMANANIYACDIERGEACLISGESATGGSAFGLGTSATTAMASLELRMAGLVNITFQPVCDTTNDEASNSKPIVIRANSIHISEAVEGGKPNGAISTKSITSIKFS